MEKYGRILIIYSYLKYEDREIWIWIVRERIVARDINGNVITNLILILAGIESWPIERATADTRQCNFVRGVRRNHVTNSRDYRCTRAEHGRAGHRHVRTKISWLENGEIGVNTLVRTRTIAYAPSVD